MKNKKFITSKISISILIISIVFIGLAIIFAVWNNNKFKEKIILSAKSNLSVKAEIIATGIEKLLSEHARISQSLANDKFIINALLNKHAHEFYTEYCPIDNIYLTHIKEIDAIMLIAEDGTLLHRHPLISDSLPVFASREDIDYVIQNHRAHISGIYSNSDGKPTVAVSYPVFYQGRFIGVIRFTILVETFIEQFILPALDENTFAIGIDNQGKLFYKPYPEFKEKTIYDFLNEDRVKYPDHDFAKRQEVLIKSVRGESGS
ncbi:MAG: cache domain-containing protein, partial [Bacteroidales bacterium]|nr:cache domain-containing protein [Bacteroidales bacterium]